MNINNGFDDIDSLSGSEKVSESSEQFQERAKKAQVQLKKIQKDEKSAHEDNQKLFLILSLFIQDSYYQNVIPYISEMLEIGVPSRGIIAFIGLFYPDATYYIADTVGKKEKINLLLNLPRYSEKTPFDELKIYPQIREWITEWIALIEEFTIHHSSSKIMMKKFYIMLEKEHSAFLYRVLQNFLSFFFYSRNVIISPEKTQEYAGFIQKKFAKTIKETLLQEGKKDTNILNDATLSSDDLFG